MVATGSFLATFRLDLRVTRVRRSEKLPPMEAWEMHRPFLRQQSRLLLASYRKWTGKELLPASGGDEEAAERLWHASFVVLSGTGDGEQILNYGNAAALALWEMDWDTLTRTPSRLTAEPDHQTARADFLRRVRREGFVRDYSGVRISAKGRRFRIEEALVWNLVDDAGNYAGQAATFSRWAML